MFSAKILLLSVLAAGSVLGIDDSEEALRYDFSFKVRLLGWGKIVQLYKITFRSGDDNALAISDLNSNNMNIYDFANSKSRFMIDNSSCSIIKINANDLALDPLFPIILDAESELLTDASSLLRLNGGKTQVEKSESQNTETLELKEKKEIDIADTDGMKKYEFTIKLTRTLAAKPEDQVPLSVTLESDDKVLSYEIFDFANDILDDDFDVPDGYYCLPKEDNAVPLPEVTLKTPSRLSFTKRGSTQSFSGWIDTRFKVRKERALDEDKSVIIDMANNVAYTIEKGNGRCTIEVLEKSDSVSAADFLYSFDTAPKMQLLKQDVSLGTLKTFVLTDQQRHNIFFTGQPEDDSSIPVKVRTILSGGQVIEDLIGGFTDDVDWGEFDVSQCLVSKSADVFRIYFSIENNTEFGNPRDFQYQLLGQLSAWTGVKEPLRFINFQPYADGSISFGILPARENSSEPKSLEVVQKIVDLVKAGNAIITKPDKSQSRVVLVTYETLGAPQATYRAVAVFWITFSVSVLTLLIGFLSAVYFIRQAPPQNWVRRQLGV